MPLTAPAVADYFRFLDFDAKPAGGASQVVQTLRSFSAAGVMNRVIGVLDNDTAGREAAQQLANTSLLPNIRYLTLPNLDYAADYPTLGPGGLETHNINGRACSIELYFGLDNLLDEDGTLIPVRWTGYNRRMRDYQGELDDKTTVQRRVTTMLQHATADHDPDAAPWTSIHALVDALLTASAPTAFPGMEFGEGIPTL